jgi:23S rRNA (adenine2503-C2)-methyltransferase
MKKDVCDFTFDELRDEMTGIGEPEYRASQVFGWIYRKGVSSFSEMTNLPGKFIEKLNKSYRVSEFACAEHLISKDGTEKFLWKLADGNNIETVFIKEGTRKTLCLSTQVGCRFKCPFCASGARGFVRNLKAFEIVDQVRTVEKMRNFRITNLVFMGIGEPLDNYDNLLKAIKIFNDPRGLNIGARKITVSTCGIIPGIKKLKDTGLQVELSVSLHAGNNKLRNELVPVNCRYPLEKLIPVLKDYYLSTGRVITLEYTLIKGKNDLLKNAEELAEIAKELKAKVNLISCNPAESRGVSGVKEKDMAAFSSRVRSRGVTVTIRKTKGADIKAACGQLAFSR